jgi:hypothetical protein
MALLAALAAGPAPPPPPARQFTLGLEHLDAPAVSMLAPAPGEPFPAALGLHLLPPGPPSHEAPGDRRDGAPAAPRPLVLVAATPPAPPGLLASIIVPPGRTGGPFPLDPLERAALRELERARSYGGPDNASEPAVLVSIPGIVKFVRDAVQQARERRLPEGARVGRGRIVRVLAREAGGAAPAAVSVLPLVLGWVAPTVGGPCDSDGVCTVTGLPEESFSALVIGEGAALVDVPVPVGTVAVRLRPLGVLRLLPAAGASGVSVRVLDDSSRLAVPVHPSLNRGRGEWLPLGDAGATVLAPAGAYVVEVRRSGPTVRMTVQLPPDVTTVVTLAPP